eukprot:6202268-Pleurochrysis_carterae.AAC.1
MGAHTKSGIKEPNVPPWRERALVRYIGEWVCGARHGQGTLLYDVEGKVKYTGQWAANKKVRYDRPRDGSPSVSRLLVKRFGSHCCSKLASSLFVHLAVLTHPCLTKYTFVASSVFRPPRQLPSFLARPQTLSASRVVSKKCYHFASWLRRFGPFQEGRGCAVYASGNSYDGEWKVCMSLSIRRPLKWPSCSNTTSQSVAVRKDRPVADGSTFIALEFPAARCTIRPDRGLAFARWDASAQTGVHSYLGIGCSLTVKRAYVRHHHCGPSRYSSPEPAFSTMLFSSLLAVRLRLDGAG